MNPRDALPINRVLLVSTGRCQEVEDLLKSARCAVVKASNGSDALSRARREKLDGIFLVSSTPDMDLAETALNLRDMHPALPMVIISDGERDKEETNRSASVLRVIPEVRVIARDELNSYLASPGWNVTTKQREGDR